MSSYKGIRHARRERNYVFAGLLCIAVSVGILTIVIGGCFANPGTIAYKISLFLFTGCTS